MEGVVMRDGGANNTCMVISADGFRVVCMRD